MLHFHSYDAYRRDLLDGVNSTLQPYDLPNLSNVLFLKIILYGDERLSVDSNSEIVKSTLRCIYPTQHDVLNKMMLLNLSCANLLGDLRVLFDFLFSLPSYLLVVFIVMLNGRKEDTALCSLCYRFIHVVEYFCK